LGRDLRDSSSFRKRLCCLHGQDGRGKGKVKEGFVSKRECGEGQHRTFEWLLIG